MVIFRKFKQAIRDRYFSKNRITVIEPTKGWRAFDFKELWAYRELLWILVSRDVRIRYKQTVLGCTWAIIQPVMGMVVFSIIFGRWAKIPSDNYPYPVFVYAGLLPWTFFANSLTASSNSVVSAAYLITKVYFPRLMIPMASIGAALVDFTLALTVMFALMIYFGVGWSLHLLALPFLLLALVFTALGVGTLLSSLTVAYRDFRFVLPFLVQVWMYATPVIFPVKLVPPQWRWALYLNPVAGIIDGFRSAFLGKAFNIDVLAFSFLASIAVFFSGIAYFEKVERRFADII